MVCWQGLKKWLFIYLLKEKVKAKKDGLNWKPSRQSSCIAQVGTFHANYLKNEFNKWRHIRKQGRRRHVGKERWGIWKMEKEISHFYLPDIHRIKYTDTKAKMQRCMMKHVFINWVNRFQISIYKLIHRYVYHIHILQ